MNLDTIASLQTDFGRIYDENFNLRDKKIYSQQIADFNERLKEIGISPNLKPKDLELKLQQKYEEVYKLLKKTPKFADADRPNDMPTKTTLNAVESAQLQEEARIRNEQIAKTRENQAKLVEDFIKQNEERITKAKSLQEKLKDKVVYAKVVIPEEEKLTQDEQKELEVLVTKAKNDTPVAGKVLTPKQELIDDFTLEIEKKIESVLKDLPEKEKEIIARTYAVEIVEKIANPEVVDERVQTVILDNIAKPKQEVVTKILQKDDELITLAKNGAVLIATKQNDDFSALEKITANLVGPKIASKILGKQNYQVTFSEVLVQGETTHTVQFGELNQQNIHELSQENIVLAKIQQHGQQFGYDKINSVFTTYLKGKVESLPAGSVIKKAYKDPIIQSIFARYGMAEPVVWQAVGQSRFVGLVMKIAPDTAGPILNMAGRLSGSEYVTGIVSLSGGAIGAGLAAQTAATTASVTLTGGIMAGEAFAGGAGAAAAGAQTGAVLGGGTPLSIAFAAIGAAVGALFGKALSAAKVWWTKHKDEVKPVVAVLGTIAAIRFLGVGPGLAVGGLATFGLLGTAGLATVATGAFGVLGFIGRSIGIAIATPVIITLLVIPPLVAFIMLVINNSAYVVPPSSSILATRQENPYISVTKIAEPSGPFENNQLPLTIKYTITVSAKKDPLSNIRFEHKCKVIKEGSTQDCAAPVEAPPTTISPTTPYVYTYETIYNSTYNDALVINTFTATADTLDKKDQSASGVASITIGDPPTNCFEIDEDSFSGNGLTYITNAVAKLMENNGYSSKICASLEGNSIEIIFGGSSGDYWGYYSDGRVKIYERGLASQEDTNYILFHEMAHVLAANDDSWYDQYLSFPGIKNDPHPYCFYNYENEQEGGWPFSERFAEAASFYANDPCGNFKQTSPSHYKFMNDVLFK